MTAVSNVVVIGAGAAGLCAACALETITEVDVVTDRRLGSSNSVMAQGGLHVPMASGRSMELMKTDMCISGRGRANEELVDYFVPAIRPAIQHLESWGLGLAKDENGEWIRRKAGGMTEPRIVGTGDSIGPALMKVLTNRVRSSERIRIRENNPVHGVEITDAGNFELLGESGSLGRWKSLIVATGGSAYEFALRHQFLTSNPSNSNNSITTSLKSLGLATIDEDLYQWHPFGIVATARDGRPTKAVPETVVEYGLRLLDRNWDEVAPIDAGREILTQRSFAAREASLTSRDDAGRHGLWLTTSDLSRAEIERSFPSLLRALRSIGSLDSEGRIHDTLVWPVLHYQLGGFERKIDCSTEVPGLFLAGEIAGGLHGTNRLMGNGLTESVVTGFQAAESAAAYIQAAKAL